MEDAQILKESACKMRLRKAWAFFLKQYLPIALVIAVCIGLIVPVMGKEVGSWKAGHFGIVQSICVICIFLIQGLSLKTDEVLQAIRAGVPLVYGIITILFITPWISVISNQMTFLRMDSRIGFVLFFAMPTTVNSGVTLATQAGGHMALALLLTVATNTLGIFTIPFYLPVLMSEVGDVEAIDPVPMLLKLLVTVFVPVCIGKAARNIPFFLGIAKRNKQYLSLATSTFLVIVPWMKVSMSSKTVYKLDAAEIFGVVAVGLGGHMVFLIFNYCCTTALRLPLNFKKSVVILASQKTLPVAMSVLAAMPEEIGEHGIIAISCVIGHLVQIIMDAFLATHWAQYKDDETPPATLALSGQQDNTGYESTDAKSPQVVVDPQFEASGADVTDANAGPTSDPTHEITAYAV